MQMTKLFHFSPFFSDFDSMPSVNQVEFNPYFQQNELKEILKEPDVKIQAWGLLSRGNADLLSDQLNTNLLFFNRIFFWFTSTLIRKYLFFVV